MRAIVYERSAPRWFVANVVSRLGGRGVAAAGPVQLHDVAEPKLPTNDWVRVRPLLSGICGSDLTVVAGRSAGFFEQVVSFPFTLGHETVGTLDDGARVAIEPALGCKVRGIDPVCPSCTSGHHGTCENIARGDLDVGLQTGYCASTGGGWSESLIAHPSQLHVVPDALSDEAAVMIEPAACAIHAARRVDVTGKDVVVIGAGTLGLLTVAALATDTTHAPKSITVAAKYPHQQRFATLFGATSVIAPHDLLRTVRASTRTMLLAKTTLARTPRLTGGVDIVFDCVGNSPSLTQSAAIVRPRGQIVVVGMPGSVTLDMAPIWQREIELIAAYAYCHSHESSDFATAIDLARSVDLGALVSARYPLANFRDAIDHANNAGPRGAIKIVLDPRPSARPAVKDSTAAMPAGRGEATRRTAHA